MSVRPTRRVSLFGAVHSVSSLLLLLSAVVVRGHEYGHPLAELGIGSGNNTENRERIKAVNEQFNLTYSTNPLRGILIGPFDAINVTLVTFTSNVAYRREATGVDCVTVQPLLSVFKHMVNWASCSILCTNCTNVAPGGAHRNASLAAAYGNFSDVLVCAQIKTASFDLSALDHIPHLPFTHFLYGFPANEDYPILACQVTVVDDPGSAVAYAIFTTILTVVTLLIFAVVALWRYHATVRRARSDATFDEDKETEDLIA